VQLGDVDAYVRMRCDPVMMAELGGPLPRDGIEAKVRRDVEAAASGKSWISMVVLDETHPSAVAGSVVLWSHDEEAEPFSEIGWMVLPEFQRRGLGKAAVRLLLERARDENRWGEVHAFPGVTNAASNAMCRTLGFTLLGEEQIDFSDRLLIANHWRIDPRTELTAAP
jgi:RimJ/RimL family protein N-acetyltransferase